jgi:hypothetical protein
MDEVLDRKAPLAQSANEADNRAHLYTALETGDIRLVEILPGHWEDPILVSIHMANLDQEPRYSALSYVWDPKYGCIDLGLEPDSISVQNHASFSLPIGTNLAYVMAHLRSLGRIQMFWSDAICINQFSDLEIIIR